MLWRAACQKFFVSDANKNPGWDRIGLDWIGLEEIWMGEFGMRLDWIGNMIEMEGESFVYDRMY